MDQDSQVPVLSTKEICLPEEQKAGGRDQDRRMRGKGKGTRERRNKGLPLDREGTDVARKKMGDCKGKGGSPS